MKSALAYEDENFSFLDDILDDLDYEYRKAKDKEESSYTPYQKTISSILRDRYYNVPKVYNNSRYYVPRSYLNFVQNYVNNNNYKNRGYEWNKNSSPVDVYNQMMNTVDYGTSTDVWGNTTKHYKDGSSYTVRQPGVSPFQDSEKKYNK